MIFCTHKWGRIEKAKHLRYDFDGLEVLIAKCKCSKCGKIKIKKFEGHKVGNLFE